MKKEEIVERNLTLTFDFLRQIIRNPKLMDDIPNGAVIDFVQKDIPLLEKRKRARRATLLFKVKNQFEKA